ncbi:MAG TPA: hypothetical protein VKV15_07220 [Bryobacteraceae bacterium]|nr:hypothetical protein [Bryobacteraceae bacterium]
MSITAQANVPWTLGASQDGVTAPPHLHCLDGSRSFPTYATYLIGNAAGERTGRGGVLNLDQKHAAAEFRCARVTEDPIARVGKAPRLLQLRMIEAASKAARHLREIPHREWMSLLADAGRQFAFGDDASATATFVSRSAGLPRVRVLKAYAALASDLARMDEILSAQGPGPARSWRLIPRGSNLAVRIPGNFPTININWLISLVLRRPVLLCASLLDPFSAHRLIQCFYQAGGPEHAISLCFHDAELFWERADQVLMSGDLPHSIPRDPVRIQQYHHGRSKVVVAGARLSGELAARLALLAVQGCGRLCTNISALLTDQGAEAMAQELASAMAAFPVLPLDQPDAFVPCFPDRSMAHKLAADISDALRRGARDITGEITGAPLAIENADGLFLRPTVLLVDADDPLFGSEAPFPFVTVANAPAAEFVRRCRNSLVVSLIGGSRELFEDLVFEPTIDKVFANDDFDRGYDPVDPHEGFLTDFLFRKKAVSEYGFQ